MKINKSELRSLIEEVMAEAKPPRFDPKPGLGSTAAGGRTSQSRTPTRDPAKGGVWDRQYKKMQGQFKKLQKGLDTKLKNLDKQWTSASNDEKNKILLELVSMRRKLMELTK